MSIDLNLLTLFDNHLETKGLKYSASIIGGAAILLIATESRVTGDVDSLLKIPQNIKDEIWLFAQKQRLGRDWFNDNASRNFDSFVMKGQEVYDKVVFDGEALTLYTPSVQALLLSKFYPILDRAAEGKDLQDLEQLIKAGVVSKFQFLEALGIFERNIRFETERSDIKTSKLLAKALKKFCEESF